LLYTLYEYKKVHFPRNRSCCYKQKYKIDFYIDFFLLWREIIRIYCELDLFLQNQFKRQVRPMKTQSLSDSQKLAILAFALVVFTCIILAIAMAQQSAPSERSSAAKAENHNINQPRPKAANISSGSIAEAPSDMQKPAKLAQAPVSKVKPQQNVGWEIGNSKSAQPQIALNQVIRDYEVVEVNQHPNSFPQVGETVELPMLHGEKILVNVQELKSNPNGDQSWTGHLQGYDNDYPIIVTYGEHAVFAMITTPKGSYTMESTDGAGWLYKNPSEVELSDTKTQDFLEVPDAHKL